MMPRCFVKIVGPLFFFKKLLSTFWWLRKSKRLSKKWICLHGLITGQWWLVFIPGPLSSVETPGNLFLKPKYRYSLLCTNTTSKASDNSSVKAVVMYQAEMLQLMMFVLPRCDHHIPAVYLFFFEKNSSFFSTKVLSSLYYWSNSLCINVV